jgi:hypothetical protein
MLEHDNGVVPDDPRTANHGHYIVNARVCVGRIGQNQRKRTINVTECALDRLTEHSTVRFKFGVSQVPSYNVARCNTTLDENGALGASAQRFDTQGSSSGKQV